MKSTMSAGDGLPSNQLIMRMDYPMDFRLTSLWLLLSITFQN